MFLGLPACPKKSPLTAFSAKICGSNGWFAYVIPKMSPRRTYGVVKKIPRQTVITPKDIFSVVSKFSIGDSSLIDIKVWKFERCRVVHIPHNAERVPGVHIIALYVHQDMALRNKIVLCLRKGGTSYSNGGAKRGIVRRTATVWNDENCPLRTGFSRYALQLTLCYTLAHSFCF